jgi:subtilase family serine protease
MHKSASLLLLCLAGVVLSTPSSAVPSNVLHTKERPDPRHWDDVSETSNFFLDAFLSKPFKFRLSLKQQNMDKIKQIALDVSNPKSGQYGKYLKQSEIDELTKPDENDVATVRNFIEASSSDKCTVTARKEVLDVACEDARIVQNMLKTKFHVLQNRNKRTQNLLRAKDFYLPNDVDEKVQGIFGLHGLPLPPREERDAPSKPASVTPSVIEQVYNIKDTKASGSLNNRQAVAEFQGQTMNVSDLTEFFKNYVPKAVSGDEKVYKFVGDPGEGSPGTEASLDIQYIMGVAPGVKTEFWYFAGSDFCGDLKTWTGMLLANDDVPLVTSVSYGWQGDLKQIGCQQADVTAVDNDLAKLATKGITIIFASGDSGSGYAPSQPQCIQTIGKKGIAYSGEVLQATHGAQNALACCYLAKNNPWTFFTGTSPSSNEYCDAGNFKNDTAITGEILYNIAGYTNPATCCDFAQKFNAQLPPNMKIQGWSFAPSNSSGKMDCTMYKSITGTSSKKGAISVQGQPPLLNTTCTSFSKVTSTKKNAEATSYTPGGTPKKTPLYPSWPASSPWVTAVGSTRFVDQKVGNEEMATDQFGSGGGFSSMFDAFKDQEEDIANYFKVAPQLPPSDLFNKTGRATPDVAALGEGYQVITSGQTKPVGGTSASAPTFAAVISLLNEARLSNGKPAMGYLNPWLYANPTILTDIVKGNNAIGRGQFNLPYGYNCTKGYDPVSGLGTPHYEKMLQSAMKL